MQPKELKKILKSHHVWLSSDGKKGERANFGRADLGAADLQGAMLNKAEFANANLVGANLKGAQLRGASFDGAELSWADFRNASLDEATFKTASLPEANLQGAQLPGASFDGAELQYADLRNTILNGAGFKMAFLTGANLQGSQLRRASFDGADLRDANLREADLQNANLENASFLLTSQLAGADVAGAKLPSAIAEFKGLETIAEATSNAQKLFVAMLGGCLYSWLTIGTTKDAALLTNSASSPLPIIGTALPIVGFYMVAPLVLLAVYFYFHLNMQRLWEALADLPAVFPDGRSLDKRADPWMLNGLVGTHFARLRRDRPPLSRLQQFLSVLLAWWVVPATIFAFWGRFLSRHDSFGIALHVILLAAAVAFGWMSYRLACATLRGIPRKIFRWAQAWTDMRIYKRATGVLASFVGGIAFYYVSLWAIEVIPRKEIRVTGFGPPAPHIVEVAGFSSVANIAGEDVSTKPSNWTGKAEEYRSVKGAPLANAQMQYVRARSAFLVNADLRNANLTGAEIVDANLWGADLSSAKLSYAFAVRATLVRAIVKGADLSNAILDGSNISEADLQGADLSNASLGHVDFSNAILDRADLMSAQAVSANFSQSKLVDADLSYADLSNADLSKADLSEAELRETKFVKAKLVGTKLSNALLSYSDFSEAEFARADLSGATFEGTILKGVDLRFVIGLTKKQMAEAITDAKTLLPEAPLP